VPDVGAAEAAMFARRWSAELAATCLPDVLWPKSGRLGQAGRCARSVGPQAQSIGEPARSTASGPAACGQRLKILLCGSAAVWVNARSPKIKAIIAEVDGVIRIDRYLDEGFCVRSVIEPDRRSPDEQQIPGNRYCRVQSGILKLGQCWPIKSLPNQIRLIQPAPGSLWLDAIWVKSHWHDARTSSRRLPPAPIFRDGCGSRTMQLTDNNRPGRTVATGAAEAVQTTANRSPCVYRDQVCRFNDKHVNVRQRCAGCGLVASKMLPGELTEAFGLSESNHGDYGPGWRASPEHQCAVGASPPPPRRLIHSFVGGVVFRDDACVLTGGDPGKR